MTSNHSKQLEMESKSYKYDIKEEKKKDTRRKREKNQKAKRENFFLEAFIPILKKVLLKH